MPNAKTIRTIIAHREYTSAAPATMCIYRNRVESSNPNVPHDHGRIDLNRTLCANSQSSPTPWLGN